jgi:hypothetical protein
VRRFQQSGKISSQAGVLLRIQRPWERRREMTRNKKKTGTDVAGDRSKKKTGTDVTG